MTKIHFKLVFLIPLIFYCGCQSTQNNQTQEKSYQCKDYKLNVPIETVDAETNGKKSGDTHFHSHSSKEEVFYFYENFATNEEAIEGLKRNERNSFRILRKGDLKDNNSNKIGEKLFISTWEDYKLIWINENRLNSVSSKSSSAIEEIEKDCNL